MTPLNTIIEEEKKAFEEKFSYGGFGGLVPQHRDGGRILMGEVQDYLATAMQRAYEAGREERDTYWKERVRKEVEGMHTYWHDTLAEEPAIQVVSKNKLLQALDNLK